MPDPTGPVTRLTAFQQMLADALAAGHAKIRPDHTAHADARLAGWLDGFEDEIAPHVAAYVADLAGDETLAPATRDLFGKLAAPEHAFALTLLISAAAAVVYPLVSAAVAPHAQSVGNRAWAADQVLPLTPAQAALAVIRGHLPQGAAAAEAAMSGVNPARFQTMVDNTGNPIAVGEAMVLLRQRLITEPDFARAVQQSDIRPEWLPQLLALKFLPVPAAEAITGALKGHLTDTDAMGRIAEAGVNPANYAWLKAAAGRPPGVTEMVQLWNHAAAGLAGFTVTQADVEQAVRQSDINDHYLPFVLQSRWYVPPVRSVLPMLRAGAITDAHASQLLAAHGVRPEDIAVYLAEGHHTRTAATKQLSTASILGLYGTRHMAAATATARLTALGYSAADITLMLQYADDQRHETRVNAVVSKLRALYVAWHIDATQVQNDLGGAGVPADAITDYLHLWGIERTANVHRPTPAQVVGAYRRGAITALDCKRRLLNYGVQQADLVIVVADGYPPTKPDPAAVLAVVNA